MWRHLKAIDIALDPVVLRGYDMWLIQKDAKVYIMLIQWSSYLPVKPSNNYSKHFEYFYAWPNIL